MAGDKSNGVDSRSSSVHTDKRCDDESVELDDRRRPYAITNPLLGFLFSEVYCLMNVGFV
ncbi:hypothetical protein HanPSC8_Chr15g0646471 [Helianthus annuus]|nr:hypothetical protein HanPSC8_Chr15g0646471 [Helianthus annuus]